MDVNAAVGARLRALRTASGWSLSELARRTGLGKGTLSELESGQRNPTLATLFSITTTLGLPLSALVPDEVGPVSGDAVDAWLVERLPGVDVFRLRVRPGAAQVSAPHAPGVTEQVLVVSGRLLVAGGIVLGPCESTTYDGGVPHRWEALDEAASAVLVMRYPVAG